MNNLIQDVTRLEISQPFTGTRIFDIPREFQVKKFGLLFKIEVFYISENGIAFIETFQRPEKDNPSTKRKFVATSTFISMWKYAL